MTFIGIAVCLALVALAAVSALASVALRPVLRRAAAAADLRAGTTLALRYAPTLLALLFAGLVFLPAFLHLEPRRSGERIGPLMIALAAASAVALLAGPLRGLRSVLATARLARRWGSDATAIALPGTPVPAFAIDTEFPLVAVVGIMTPRLFVARRVLRSCTGPEMAAIVAHEASHHRRRDNLMLLLLRSCPDLLGFSAVARDLERAWSEACDRAADDFAARRGSGVDLAAALVKVARTLDAPAPAGAVLAAFCHGDDIAGRVRRLLEPPPSPGGVRWAERLLPVLLSGSVLAAFLIGRSVDVRLGVHGVAESLVRLLQ